MTNTKITFDQLPDYVYGLVVKMESVESLLRHIVSNHTEQDKWFCIKELSDYLPIKNTVSTIRRKAQQKLIPHHGRGRDIRFLKSEIDQWLRTGVVPNRSDELKTFNSVETADRWKNRHSKNDISKKYTRAKI